MPSIQTKTQLLFNCNNHRYPTLTQSILHATLLSTIFVLNLYLLVPSNVRKLPRNHLLHIKWRILSVVFTSLLSIFLIYPFFFCVGVYYDDENYKDGDIILLPNTSSSTSSIGLHDNTSLLWTLLGFNTFSWKPIFHVFTLYLGPITVWTLDLLLTTIPTRTTIIQNNFHDNNEEQNKNNTVNNNNDPSSDQTKTQTISKITCQKLTTLLQKLYHDMMEKYQYFQRYDTYRYMVLRDYIIAPFVEELVFRSCIVTPFLIHGLYQSNSGGSHRNIPSFMSIYFMTPLFFGLGHVHHAFLKIRECTTTTTTTINGSDKMKNIRIIILTTLFQLLYTTIFGSYETYAFIHSGSLWSIFLVHSFCNFWGLPSFQFLFQRNDYKYSHYREKEQQQLDEEVNIGRYKMIWNSFCDNNRYYLVKLSQVIGCVAYIVGIVCFRYGFYSEEELWWNNIHK